MSKILRRPMFRGGGKVSSYGTGIASGLADTSKPKRGLVDEPGGYAGISMSGIPSGEFNRIFNTSPTPRGPINITKISEVGDTLGKNVVNEALKKTDRMFNLGQKVRGAGIASLPYLAAAAPVAAVSGLAYMNRPKTVEALQYMKEMNESGFSDETAGDDYTEYAETFKMLNETGTPLSESSVGLLSSKEDISSDIIDRDMVEFEEGMAPGAKRKPGESSLDALLRESLETAKKRDLDEKPLEEPKIDIKAEIEKDKELFKELLGADKARGQDIADMLLRFSGSEGDTVGEKFRNYTKAESAAGSSRTEKINQTAAGLAINDYIAGKRSRESLNEILGKTKFGVDYQAEVAGRATAVSGGENPEDWVRDLRNVASRTRDKQITDTDVIKTTLFERYKTPVNVKSFPKKTIESIVNQNAGDLSVGYNIVISKDGKYIIEKKQNGESSIKINLPIT
jgi:hypothetical protein